MSDSAWRGNFTMFQTTDGDWRVMDCSRINSDYDETLYWGPNKGVAQDIFDRNAPTPTPEARHE